MQGILHIVFFFLDGVSSGIEQLSLVCHKSAWHAHLEVKLNVHVLAKAARVVVTQRLGIAEGLERG